MGDEIVVIYKCGDDLRQDQLTLQILRIMERRWERAGLDLKLSPYLCVATGDELGFIEVVLESNTTANITKQYSRGASGAFAKEPMSLFLQEHNRDSASYRASVETFLYSLAGYCVATYAPPFLPPLGCPPHLTARGDTRGILRGHVRPSLFTSPGMPSPSHRPWSPVAGTSWASATATTTT